MPFNELMFRNVDGSSSDPVDSWHHEVFASILAYGGANEYAPVMNEIFRDPWGNAARSVEEILGYTDPEDEEEHIDPGTYALFEFGLRSAREEAEQKERGDVAAELSRLFELSGLTRAEFAARLGTSTSRLSTYLAAKVSPRASLMVRATRVAARAEQPA